MSRSVRVSLGDCVLVNTGTGSDLIGLIKYIGYVHEKMNTEYIGVELLEPITNGHDGTIDGYKYFTTPKGHGIHIQINDIIKKLNMSELMMKVKDVMCFFKTKLTQYVTALNERDMYIEKLKQKQKGLKLLLNQSSESTISNNRKNENDSNHSDQYTPPTVSNRAINIEANNKSHCATNQFEIMTDTCQTKRSDPISTISDQNNSQNAYVGAVTSMNTNFNNTHLIASKQTYQSASPTYFRQFQPILYNNQSTTTSPTSPLSPIQYQIIPAPVPSPPSRIHFQQIKQIPPQNHQKTVIMPPYIRYQTQPQQIKSDIRYQIRVQNGIPVYQQNINIPRRSTK